MKTITRSLLTFIVLLTACAPQSVATLPPTLVSTSTPIATNTPLATTTPAPTQTLEPTPTPINYVDQIPNDDNSKNCTRVVEAKTSSTGIFEVVFADSEYRAATAGEHPSLALWSEDTQKAVPFPLTQDDYRPKLSTDHSRVIFQRDNGETHEIWMMDADGQNEKRLTTVRYDETEARYAAELAQDWGVVDYDYGWIPNTDKIFYYVGMFYDVGGYYDKAVLVEVNSGRTISLAVPPKVTRFWFAPDGSQMAVITESEFRVLSTQNGQVLFTIQASLYNP